VARNVDWPESVWTAWIAFEDYHGTAESLNAAKIRVAPLQEALAAQRMQVGDLRLRLLSMLIPGKAQATSAYVQPVTAAVNETTAEAAPSAPVNVETHDDQAMEVDGVEDSRKRKADVAIDTADTPDNKRQRVQEEKDAGPVRDREYATVLVSGLAADTAEADVRKFFRECGQIREVTLTPQGEQMVAAVEFMDRQAIPAALTRDKKRVGENEVHVYQAGHTTLFVTNFPEKMDDAALRELFAPYGDIVETRWPSRKYKDSRRFCYVQFTTTGAAATASQELHGKELESGFPISVLISDPERKKERSDAHADARELYVNQLSKFMNEQDMERVFSPVCTVRILNSQPAEFAALQFGKIKRISLTKDDQGKCKGFGFVEFETEVSISFDTHLTCISYKMPPL
jgi:RNA recognition motif-containing protein